MRPRGRVVAMFACIEGTGTTVPRTKLANLERTHMDLLLPLWLPILLSAGAVWIASMIFGMALPHHKQDWIALPDEDGFMDDLRSAVSSPATTSSPISATPSR